jgi:hypothetical protein
MLPPLKCTNFELRFLRSFRRFLFMVDGSEERCRCDDTGVAMVILTSIAVLLVEIKGAFNFFLAQNALLGQFGTFLHLWY